MAPNLMSGAAALARSLDSLSFNPPVAYVYNPLVYAMRPYARYLEMYGDRPRDVVFVGMNPGPWGMAQTGVPFGAIAPVREWLGIEAPVDRPVREHAKRPILGFDCKRQEVSGQRVWSWARERFGTAERFFQRFFIANYCPLLFLDEGGRNLTPDKLRAADRTALYAPCDRALRNLVETLGAKLVVGFGAFAETRAREALDGLDLRVGRVLHPSPASPAANRGWAEAADRDLRALGVDIPKPS